MDRYEEEKPTKPSKRYYTYASSKGKFMYYDKELGEKIYTDYPFRFMLLASYFTVVGFSESANTGIYSNEVLDFVFDPVTVNIGDEKITGLWSSISNKVKQKGGKFAVSVYVAMYDENKEMYIANIKFSGSSIGPWFDFCKKSKVQTGAIEVKKNKPAKKGANNYNLPVFELIKTTKATEEKVQVKYEELKEYMNSYFKAAKSAQPEVDISDLAPTKSELVAQAIEEVKSVKPVEDDDLPF